MSTDTLAARHSNMSKEKKWLQYKNWSLVIGHNNKELTVDRCGISKISGLHEENCACQIVNWQLKLCSYNQY